MVLRPVLVILVLAAAAGRVPARAAPPPATTAPPPAATTPPPATVGGVGDEIVAALRSLDSDDFAARQKAIRRLAELARVPEQAARLNAEAQRLLVDPQTSLEARVEIDRLLSQLPAGIAGGAPEGSEKIDAYLGQLASQSYAMRDGAGRQLVRLLSNPTSGVALLAKLDEQLANPQLSSHERTQLEGLWRRAQAAWLLDSSGKWRLPAVGDKQIDAWLAHFVDASDQDVAGKLRIATAQRRLLALLARDEYRGTVLHKIDALLTKPPEAAAAQRLARLRDWTRPAMVAEIWRGQQHVTVQHLLVGVPQFPDAPFAVRATHFDRIDDRTAHCVSGNTLTAGDYPVGLAIAHPQGQDMFIHLVNLPTVRDRLAYEYRLEQNQADRLRAITQRTLDRVMADGRRLSETEPAMLRQLDPRLVSRFVGPYFERVLEPSLRAAPGAKGQAQLAELVTICDVLAQVGTHEAIPMLESAARTGRLAPTAAMPYHMGWVAALAIAKRDPWPDVDAWLAGVVSQDALLAWGAKTSPELGATAAALLLRRHSVPSRGLGLIVVEDGLLPRLGLAGHRFNSAEARTKVAQWWKAQRQRLAARDKP